MKVEENEFDIPEENTGKIPYLFVFFLGLMLGWAVTYFYYNVGSFGSLSDGIGVTSFCTQQGEP